MITEKSMPALLAAYLAMVVRHAPGLHVDVARNLAAHLAQTLAVMADEHLVDDGEDE